MDGRLSVAEAIREGLKRLAWVMELLAVGFDPQKIMRRKEYGGDDEDPNVNMWRRLYFDPDGVPIEKLGCITR